MAGEEYLRRLDRESVKLLQDAGYLWDSSIPGFWNRSRKKGISYEETKDSTPAQIAEWLHEQGDV